MVSPNVEKKGSLRARSALFVSALAHEKHSRAFASGADAVIGDLEDAVPTDGKAAARELLPSLAASRPQGVALIIRVNDPSTEDGRADLAALEGLKVDAVMVPKATPEAVGEAGARCFLPLIALVETAVGVLQAAAIARHPAVGRLMMGPLDLSAELGCGSGYENPQLTRCRSDLVLASSAAELPAPLDGPSPVIGEAAGLEREIQLAGELGFGGKACIHPAQVAAVNEGFRPSSEELAWATKVVDALDREASGVAVLDGEMVDRPVLLRARRILEMGKGRR